MLIGVTIPRDAPIIDVLKMIAEQRKKARTRLGLAELPRLKLSGWSADTWG